MALEKDFKLALSDYMKKELYCQDKRLKKRRTQFMRRGFLVLCSGVLGVFFGCRSL